MIVSKVLGGGRTTQNVKMQARPEVKGNTTKCSKTNSLPQQGAKSYKNLQLVYEKSSYNGCQIQPFQSLEETIVF